MDRDCRPFSLLHELFPHSFLSTYDESTNKRTYNRYRIFRFSPVWPEGEKRETKSLPFTWNENSQNATIWMLEDKLGQSVSDPNPAWDLSFLFTAPILDNLQTNTVRIQSLIKTMAREKPRCHFHFSLFITIFLLFFRTKSLENWNIMT